MWLDSLWVATCPGCDAPGPPGLCRVCEEDQRLQEAAYEGLKVWALAPYPGPTAKVLVRAKYSGDRGLMDLLARSLAAAVAALPGRWDAVVPVPSPWTRRLSRGFAPAAVLAARVAPALGAPLRHALRLAPGTKQASLDAAGRQRNLVGRLRAVRPVPGRVLLVDDAVTTGTTARSCARELLGDHTETVDILGLVSTSWGEQDARP
ncbi:MAG: ComF family protein [Myxococcales bacterium]|nr:ComF family protein [Myxococcales bacterium]